MKHIGKTFGLALGLATGLGGAANAQLVHASDVVIQGSLCVGFDCSSGISFGFDTLRLKENNLRINFEDTSTSASFPTTDWRIRINDSSNGGAGYFGVEDATAGRTPFRVEAGAPNHALYVDDGGRVGVGTATPVVDLHTVSGNTPTLRLEQDGSSGFTAQTWDLAGNEANFFVRDVTNGSQLPLKIKPGADTGSLFVAANNSIGLGTESPSVPLHVRRTDGTAAMLVEEAGSAAAARGLLELRNNDTVFLALADTGAGGETWNIQSNSGELRFTNSAVAGIEMQMTTSGNMTIAGELTTSGSCSIGCDRVFDEEYDLLSIEDHANLMFENSYLPAVGPTAEEGQYQLTSKVLGMLNELEHAHIYISELHENQASDRLMIEQLEARLQGLEALLPTLQD